MSFTLHNNTVHLLNLNRWVLFLFDALYTLVWLCFQVEHIFSHIHQTYIVQAVIVPEEEVDDSQVHAEYSRWVTKEEFSSAAVSTAMKKVYLSL